MQADVPPNQFTKSQLQDIEDIHTVKIGAHTYQCILAKTGTLIAFRSVSVQGSIWLATPPSSILQFSISPPIDGQHSLVTEHAEPSM